jgi:hypothetical protein
MPCYIVICGLSGCTKYSTIVGKKVTEHKICVLIFLYNKTNQFHKFILSRNSTCFGQFVCPSSAVHSLYTRHWYMLYRFEDSFRAGTGWNCSSILVILESCLQTCMTYNTADDGQRNCPKHVEFRDKINL